MTYLISDIHSDYKGFLNILANYDDVPENLISAIVQSNSTRKDFIADSIMQRANYLAVSGASIMDKEQFVVGIYRLTIDRKSVV